MKKFRNILLIVMTVMMTASCVEEMADPAYGEHELSFTASFDSDDDTKSILVDGKDVHWLPGDCISVSGASDAFVSDASAQCAVTTFTGSALPAETYFAVYPYESVVSWNGEVASVNVPANQTAVKGTFSDDLNISASRASSSDMNMSFHNVLGYMKFTIGEDSGSIRSVEVSAIGGESLAGAAEISYDSRTGQPSLVSTTESQTVTLSSESALEPGDYYIAMIPGTYTEGLTLTFVATDYRVATKEIKTELTLGKGVIQNIGTVKNLTFELPFDPAEIPDDEIWYVTSNSQIIDIEHCTQVYGNSPFNVPVISNTYIGGKGVIKCDGRITKINRYAMGNSYLSQLYLPNTIEELEEGAISNTQLKTLNIPQSFKKGGEYSIGQNDFLESFTGSHVTEDGRAVVVDGVMYAFAPAGLTSYELPEGISVINNSVFFENDQIKDIVLPEGLRKIGGNNFYEYTALETFTIPESVEDIEGILHRCPNIKAFYGNSKFVSEDNAYLYKDDFNGYGKWMIKYASKAGYTSYIIPEGIEGINNDCFYYVESLEELTFPSTIKYVYSGDAFLGTNNIKKIYGPSVLSDNRSLVVDGQLLYVAPKGLTHYITPEGVTNLAYESLSRKPELVSVIISDEVVAIGDALSCRPYEIPLGYILTNNPRLKTITISANLRVLGMDPFGHGVGLIPDNLETVYLRAPIPPIIGHNQPENIPTLFPNLTIYVPEESLEAYKASPDWTPYKGYIKGYKYTDLPENDTYVSSDYSKDGVVTTLQTAAKGEGIDIVLMGDAYSDRQIADGTYKADMEYMYDNLFTQEPFKTHKDMFNVYYVNVVSATEGYEYGNTALDGFFGDGTLVGGSDDAVFSYAQEAISADRIDEALLIVAMNSDAYAGTCYMYYPESATGTYGSGPSVAYFPKGEDEDMFAQLLHHEANGHGFAKLADEYAYEALGTVPDDYAAETQEQQVDWGWWKNVDFTDDVEDVRWSYFLADERYDNEGLGCFEGGLTYWSGVWRPTENSIMRYNTGGFNAPSREAIYYRIHKLAYGDSWEYDYEDFVEYDAVNRTAAASAARRQRVNYVERAFEPTAAPVVTGRSWRQAR